jgi:hypothetical protein
MWAAQLARVWRQPRFYGVLALLVVAVALAFEVPITGRARQALLALFALGAVTL